LGICAASLGGCTPNLHHLLADRHYHEALAYVAGTNQADQERVADAILRDLAPQIHVAVGQIAAKDGRPAEVSILRLRVATNKVPLAPDFLSVDSASSALVGASLSTLAPALDEKILACYEVTPGAVAAVASGIITAMTLGIVRPDPRPYTVCPSDEAQHRAAPRATAIAPELHRGCAREPDRLQCTYDFLMPGSATAPRISPEPFSFLFRFRFAVQLPHSSRAKLSTTFAVERQYELIIPRGLPTANEQPFGKTFRPLTEVAQQR
jgi:hypothetical protein